MVGGMCSFMKQQTPLTLLVTAVKTVDMES